MAKPFITPKLSDFRERIRVERIGEESDGFGGIEDGQWSLLSNCCGVPACVAPTTGGEEVRSNRLSGISNFTVTVRGCPNTLQIKPADRIVNENDASQVLNILHVANYDLKRQFLTIICEAGGQ